MFYDIQQSPVILGMHTMTSVFQQSSTFLSVEHSMEVNLMWGWLGGMIGAQNFYGIT